MTTTNTESHENFTCRIKSLCLLHREKNDLLYIFIHAMDKTRQKDNETENGIKYSTPQELISMNLMSCNKENLLPPLLHYRYSKTYTV